MSCRRHFFRSFSLHIGLTLWKKGFLALQIKMERKFSAMGRDLKMSYLYVHIMALVLGWWCLTSMKGCNLKMKKIVETMCGGDIMSKILDEEIQFLEYVANVSIKDGKILYLIENWLELKILHNHLVEEEFII